MIKRAIVEHVDAAKMDNHTAANPPLFTLMNIFASTYPSTKNEEIVIAKLTFVLPIAFGTDDTPGKRELMVNDVRKRMYNELISLLITWSILRNVKNQF